jgi:outer membrane autotransporter protein
MGKLYLLSQHFRRTEWDRAEVDPGSNIHVSRFWFDSTWVRTLPAMLARVGGAVAALGLMVLAPISPSHAQAPPLGTAASFAVLAGTDVTDADVSALNATVITGNLGVYPGTSCTGFTASAIPPCTTLGFGVVNGTVYVAPSAVAQQAQADNLKAFDILTGEGGATTGPALGGLTLTPGVYNLSSGANLTGTLTLNGLGNPNSVFIFNVASGLTTGSNSKVVLINGAQGGNVFWTVSAGSATLGVSSLFEGDILAYASISLDPMADINCGAAWAQTGGVTLAGKNIINICSTTFSAASALPSSATAGEISVANAIDTFVSNGGTLPLAFQSLLAFLSPSQLAAAFTQLEGEAGTGAQESGFQMMNSFLSLLTNPFAENRGFAPPPQAPLIYKMLAFKAPPGEAAPEPRRWSIWAAAYGGGGNINGDPTGVGSNNLTTHEGGYATGLDYLVTPDTLVGFALAGGGTSWSLAAGLGGGRSDVFQAGVYGAQRYGAAYLSGALTYASYWASTSRTVSIAGPDALNASFIAQNFGGRLEGGYRVTSWAPFSVIPYAAVQAQSFRTPRYNESGALGAPDPFALTYNAQTATQVRSELGSRFDQVIALADGSSVVPFGRVAWAHDWQSNPNLTATFIGLPGAPFVAYGAAPPSNVALVTAGAEWRRTNGWSVMAKFDGEFANGYDAYTGTGGVRYSW